MIEVSQKRSFDADQVELKAFRDGLASVAAGSWDERVSGQAFDGGDEESGFGKDAIPKWEFENIGLEHIEGETLEVLHARDVLLGPLYPFTIQGNGLVYEEGRSSGIYEFFLATCDAVSNPARKYRRLVRHFERIVTSLLVGFCGPGARGHRFGWPSEAGFDEVENGRIQDRIRRLRSDCEFDEDDWLLSSSPYMQKTIEAANDAKIDIVVRRSLLDSRPGCLTLIGQCGCGKHDVDEDSSKHKDVGLNWLRTLFDRFPTPDPIFVFATSQHVACPSQVYKKQQESNTLLFDRMRLVKMADEYSGKLSLRDINHMRQLTEFVRKNSPSS